jgi:hypothetical protein
MNKAKIGTFLLAGAIALVAMPVAAGAATGHPGPIALSKHDVAWRFANQQHRIMMGLKSGQLSPREYARDEANLRNDEALRQADLRTDGGSLTRAQRAQLEQSLNHNSGRIYETKHNRVKNPGTTNF